ncbi:MAG: sulfite exporter TauE/SafE family protein [Paracoccaceae bacterium]
MIIDPFILFLASVTFFIGGLAKGALGFGLPILAIPLLTAFGSLPLALSIAVPPVVATNIWQVWRFRAHRNMSLLRWFIIVGAIGLVVGTVLLKNIENAYLEVMLGCLVLSYLVRRTLGGGDLSQTRSTQLAPFAGGFAGVVHGTTGLSGMVGTPFFHASGLTRPAFIFANSLMFIVFSALHMPALAALGLYQNSAIYIGLIVTIPAFGGLWIGGVLAERLKETTFPILVQCMLLLAAILPIWNGLSKLLGPN